MNPPTIFKEMYHILFLAHVYVCGMLIPESILVLWSFLAWVFMPKLYLIASQLTNPYLIANQLITDCYSYYQCPSGQHWLCPSWKLPSSLRASIFPCIKTNGQKAFWYQNTLHIYSYVFLSLHAAEKLSIQQTNFSSIEWCVEQKLGIFFFSHK